MRTSRLAAVATPTWAAHGLPASSHTRHAPRSAGLATTRTTSTMATSPTSENTMRAQKKNQYGRRPHHLARITQSVVPDPSAPRNHGRFSHGRLSRARLSPGCRAPHTPARLQRPEQHPFARTPPLHTHCTLHTALMTWPSPSAQVLARHGSARHGTPRPWPRLGSTRLGSACLSSAFSHDQLALPWLGVARLGSARLASRLMCRVPCPPRARSSLVAVSRVMPMCHGAIRCLRGLKTRCPGELISPMNT